MLSITRERFISFFNRGAALRGCQGNIGDAQMFARFHSEFPGASVPELAAYVFGYGDNYASAEDTIQLLAEHDDLVDGGNILSHSEERWDGFVDLS